MVKDLGVVILDGWLTLDVTDMGGAKDEALQY